MADSIGAHVDDAAFTSFAEHYLNTPLPHGSVSTILTEAFNALVDAGVVVLDGPLAAYDKQFAVHGGRVWLYSHDPKNETDPDGKTVWTGDSLPSFAPVVRGLADLLVAVVDSEPHTGPIDFPHTRN